jgi:hypothetical protein
MDTAVKQTEKLTEAVLNLAKRMQRSEELAKKSNLLGKASNSVTSLKEGISNKLSDAFSLKSVGSMLGMGNNTMIGKILEARHEEKKEKAKDAKNEVLKAKQFADNQIKYTPEGQALAEKSQEAAVKYGVAMYEKQKTLLIEIQKIKEQIKQAEETGHGDAAKEYHKESLTSLEKEYKEITNVGKTKKNPKETTKPAKDEPTTQPETSLPDAVKDEPTTKVESNKEELERLRESLIERGEVIRHATEELEKNTGRPLTDNEKAGLENGIREGMDEELLALNKEQLDALHKLVKNSEQTEEDKLEARKTESITSVKTTEVKKEETKKSFLDSIMNIASLFTGGNLLKTLGTMAAKVAGPVATMAASAIGKLASVGFSAAKSVGSAILGGGANLAKTGIAKLAGIVPSVTGTGMFSAGASKVGSVVSSTASTVGKLASGAGKAVGVAAKAAGPLGAVLDVGMGASDLIDGKAQEDLPSGFDILSPMRWGLYAGDKINKGVSALTGGSSVGSLLADQFQTDPMAQMSKVAKTPRESQMQHLKETVLRGRRIEEMKKADTSSNVSAPVIVNNQTVNNPTKATMLAPPVRNFEPSYNARLRGAFV